MLSIYLKKERCLFMNTEKLPTLALGGVLLVGCLTVYKTAAASQNGSTSPTSTASPQPINTFAPLLSEITEDGWTDNNVSCEETFKLYEQFVLTYDAGKNELLYNGKVVRWFEDYYPIADTSQAGRDLKEIILPVHLLNNTENWVFRPHAKYFPCCQTERLMNKGICQN